VESQKLRIQSSHACVSTCLFQLFVVEVRDFLCAIGSCSVFGLSLQIMTCMRRIFTISTRIYHALHLAPCRNLASGNTASWILVRFL
jgi:hypothetical protein